MKQTAIFFIFLFASGCTFMTPAPKVLYPTPPEVLMKPPQELETIKPSKPLSPTTQPVSKPQNN